MSPYLTPQVQDLQKYLADGWVEIPENYKDMVGIPEWHPLPEADPEIRGTNVVFKHFTTNWPPVNWYYAKAACHSLGDGVTLARTFNMRENWFVANYFPADKYGIWLAGNDLDNEGNWVWADNPDDNTGISIKDVRKFSRWTGWTGEWPATPYKDCLVVAKL